MFFVAIRRIQNKERKILKNPKDSYRYRVQQKLPTATIRIKIYP